MQEWTNQKNNEVTLDFARIGRMLVKRAWLIVAVVLVFALAAYIFSACFIAPTYMSYFTAYVNNRLTTDGMNSTSVSDLNASIGLANLYSQVLTSRTVLTEAAAQCGINASYSELSEKVSSSISETAALITVKVVDTDPERAARYAQAIADVGAKHVTPYVEGSSMLLVDPPIVPEGKYGPSNTKNALLGGVIGLVLVVGILVILDLVNDKVDTAENLEQRHHIPVIGMIPDKETAEKYGSSYGERKGGSGRR